MWKAKVTCIVKAVPFEAKDYVFTGSTMAYKDILKEIYARLFNEMN